MQLARKCAAYESSVTPTKKGNLEVISNNLAINRPVYSSGHVEVSCVSVILAR